MSAANPALAAPVARNESLTRVATASMVGTVIEWFDFNLFGSMAALVLGPLFFPSHDPVTSTMLSLATFAVAFVARPLGGIVFGHLGDRLGRKRSLVLTLTLMGGATFAIGLLPTYAAVGVAAPVLLVCLRIVQGLAVGGEYGGAILMVVEHGDAARRRGFYGAWLGAAAPIGFILAAGVIALVTAGTTEAQFASWGWRIPFLVSAMLVLTGLYVRLRLAESGEFQRLVAGRPRETTVRFPLLELLRRHPTMVLVSIGVPVGVQGGYYLTSVFGLSYARSGGGFSNSESLVLLIIASLVYVPSILAAGALSDRVGRRLPMLIGLLGFGAWSFALFPLLGTGEPAYAVVGFTVGLVALGMILGPMGAWLSELFGTAVRYTGISFGYQIAGAIAGGVSPVLAVALMDRYGSSTPIAGYALVICLLAAAFLGIGRRVPLGMDTGHKGDTW
jgi:MFS family permease